MLSRFLSHASLTILFLSLCSNAQAISDFEIMEPDTMNFSLGTGVEFETGKYGTGQSVDTWRIPLLVEWFPFERFSLALEIPYLHQSGTGETILLGGGSAPTNPGHNNGTTGGGGPSGPATTTIETTGSESGLGDITLDASFVLFREKGRIPRLMTLLYAKLPTADEEKGLGTGEFDWGGGLGLGKKISNWSIYAEALYIIPGTSDAYEPVAYWEWLTSLNYRTGSSLLPGISLSGGTAPFDGSDDPLEVKLRLGVLTGEHSSCSLYLARGLSDGSPEWAAGVFGYLDF